MRTAKICTHSPREIGFLTGPKVEAEGRARCSSAHGHTGQHPLEKKLHLDVLLERIVRQARRIDDARDACKEGGDTGGVYLALLA